MSKQNITEATNRLCDLIPNGHLLADTMPADFINAVADRIVILTMELQDARKFLKKSD